MLNEQEIFHPWERDTNNGKHISGKWLRWYPLLLAAGLAACGGSGSDSGGEPATGFNGNDGPQVSLKPAASDQELEDYLKSGFTNAANGSLTTVDQGIVEAVADDSSAAALNFTSESFTTTNVQVGGVDEADYWKFNGDHFYYRPDYYASNDISVMAAGQPPRPIGDVALDFSAENLFVSGTTLVALGAMNYASPYWTDAYYYRRAHTQMAVFDIGSVTDSADAAEQTLAVELDGQLVASRRIGDELFLVTRYTADLEAWIDYPQTEAERAANDELLAQTSLADLLPSITVNGETEVMVQSSGCYLVQEETYGYPTLTSITRINLQTGAFSNGCVAGPVSGMYMSEGSAYLFNSTYSFVGLAEIDVVAEDTSEPVEQTHIHKFNVADMGYVDSNVVAGRSSCNERRYCFGELTDGSLALVTTLGWGESIEHNLTVLAADDLSVRAQLPNDSNPAAIGKPGESLYSARFLSDRAYLVTFEQVDPLYVLDLSDSSAPAILGELEVPGFSEYLHPINEGLLLGIGRDTVTDSEGFTWLQGVKVDLYDVSDMSQPSQVASYSLGKRGSYTDVAWDSHAFTGQLVGDQYRFVLPVSIHDGSDNSGDPSTYYDWQYSGYQAFEVDLSQAGAPQMVPLTASRIQSGVSQYGPGARSTLIGDQLYYLYQGRVYISDWADTGLVEAVQ